MTWRDALIVLSYIASSIAGLFVWWRLRGLSRQVEQISQSVRGVSRRVR